MLKRWLITFWLLFVLFWLLCTANLLKIGFNRTPSEPLGWYVLMPFWRPLARGELVDVKLPDCVWIKERHYVHPGEHLVKSVGAVSGEWLFTIAGAIFACPSAVLASHCRKLGQCVQKDHKGFPVFCQSWHGWRIPAGYYYLQSIRVPNSLDSRYFGVVSKQQMLHRVLYWQQLFSRE